MSALTRIDEGGRILTDCPRCGQTGRVHRSGQGVRFHCFAKCRDDEVVFPAGVMEAMRAELDARDDGAAPVATAHVAELRFVTLDEFVDEDEPSAEPLLGTDEEAAFTVGGTIITYGDGGTSKTTLAIDGIAHLAAGIPWLGLEVPRPVRIVVIENEGPRGRFRKKLRRKIEAWEGPPFEQNVQVMDEPWCEFSFAHEQHRAQLARFCEMVEADLLVAGPLVAVGVEGGGTPDEVRDFEALLVDFRRRLPGPIAVWIAHHENKSGDVSGAWERMPDTLMHVRLEGRGKTRLHWRKTRWASELHDDAWTLVWVGHEGFERVEQPERDVRAEIRALWEEGPEPSWRTVTEVAAKREDGGIGRQRKDVERELDALADEGEFERVEGPPGRSKRAVCYRPAVLDRGSSQVSQVAPPVPSAELDRPRPPIGGGGSSRTAERVGTYPGPDQVDRVDGVSTADGLDLPPDPPKRSGVGPGGEFCGCEHPARSPRANGWVCFQCKRPGPPDDAGRGAAP